MFEQTNVDVSLPDMARKVARNAALEQINLMMPLYSRVIA
jgi:hypothetical protein